MVLIEDHYVPCPNDKVAGLLKVMKDFVAETGVRYFRGGEGICHRLMPERGYVRPGGIVVGGGLAQHHLRRDQRAGKRHRIVRFRRRPLYRAGLACGCPKAFVSSCGGRFARGVYAKDLALTTVGRIGADGATYCAIEYGRRRRGGVGTWKSASRCATWESRPAPRPRSCPATPLPNPGSAPIRTCPTMPSTGRVEARMPGRPIATSSNSISPPSCPRWRRRTGSTTCIRSAIWADKPIDAALIGTCTNGSVEDLRIAAEILSRHGLAEGVRLLIVPPSRDILNRAMREGLIGTLVEKGAGAGAAGLRAVLRRGRTACPPTARWSSPPPTGTSRAAWAM